MCKPEFKERRPSSDGYADVTPEMTTLEPYHHVEVTSDGVHPLTYPGLVHVLASLPPSGWDVHVAIAGASAWIMIDRSDAFFHPVLRVYTADHLKDVEYLFRTPELVAGQLPGAQPQSF